MAGSVVNEDVVGGGSCVPRAATTTARGLLATH